MNPRSYFVIGLAVVFSPLPALTWGQAPPCAVAQFETTGIVRGVKAGQLTVRHPDGIRLPYKIQDQDEEALSLAGGQYIFRMPAIIAVSGQLPAHLIEPGMLLEFESELNKFGKQKGEVKKLKTVNVDVENYRIDLESEPTASEYAKCQVVGRVIRSANGKISVCVPKSRLAKQGRISFKLARDAAFDIQSDNLNRVRVGDIVTQMKGVKLDDGTLVISEIEIDLTAKREVATISYHEKLEQEFSHLSDEPTEPREVRSDHFVLLTDISPKSSAILLAKLETMCELIADYYSRRPHEAIECYVVSDLTKWGTRIPPVAREKIASGAGVTATIQIGGRVKSVVFAGEDHGVVQHECVHAFCGQAFGSPGPVWYAEGMAELGQYWQPDQLEVDVSPVVIDYLTHAKPKKMADIVRANEITGDSWRAYAWRWALCHLLANNPNYCRPFKRLGIQIMQDNAVSFAAVFGEVANEISFEYDQFIENLGNGYRVDLCVWHWNTTTLKIDKDKIVKARVLAKSGWQATRLQVKHGKTYDFISKGTWKIAADGIELTADGNQDGEGQLIGVVMDNYILSDPINFGSKGSFVAPCDGQLYLRCSDNWVDLADNSGEVECFLRLSRTDLASASSAPKTDTAADNR